MVNEKELFGRCHHQLILVALLMYPFGIKEAPRRRVLSHVSLSGVSQDSVAPHISDDSAILGNHWLHSGLLGLRGLDQNKTNNFSARRLTNTDH